MHFKRNLVRDANGQFSVSYLDPRGKVVATALAGVTPASLEPLDYAVPEVMTVEYATEEANTVDADGLGRSLVREVLVSTESPYSFAYSHAGASHHEVCGDDGRCFDCVYDVSLSLLDECGTERLDGGAWTATNGAEGETCSGGGLAATIDSDGNLEPGAYTLEKRLRLDLDAMEVYAQAWIDDDDCTLGYADFESAATATVDLACGVECHDCQAELADFATVHAELLAQDPATWQAAYDALQAECDELCDDSAGTCEGSYQAMLGDLSPGGQYGAYLDDNGDYAPDDDPTSIFHFQSHLLPFDTNTNLREPIDWTLLALQHNIPIQNGDARRSVIEQWDEAIAVELFDLHPEACLYRWSCEVHDVDASDAYDHQLLGVDAFADAQAKGWLGPDLWTLDPWFDSGSGSLADIIQRVGSYQTIGTTSYSMEELAYGMANCPTLLASSQDCTQQPFSLSTDDEWASYRALYLSAKQELMQAQRRDHAMAEGCYNGCVGNDDFNPVDYGFCTPPDLYCADEEQTCWTGAVADMVDKTPRFPETQHLAGNADTDLDATVTALQSQWADWLWENCHVCPELWDLQTLLDGLAGDRLLVGDTEVSEHESWPATLSEAMQAGTTDPVSWSATTTGQELSATLDGPFGTCTLELVFAPSTPASVSWDQATAIHDLTGLDPPVLLPQSTVNFTVEVEVGGLSFQAEGASDCPIDLESCLSGDDADPCAAEPTELIDNGDFEAGRKKLSLPDLDWTAGCPDEAEWTVTRLSGGGCGGSSGCPGDYPDHTAPLGDGRHLLTGPNTALDTAVLWQGTAQVEPELPYVFRAWAMDADDDTWGASPELWLRVDGDDVATLELGEEPGWWRPLEGTWSSDVTTAGPVTLEVVAFYPVDDNGHVVPTGAIGIDDLSFHDASCEPRVLCGELEAVSIDFIDTCESHAVAVATENAQAAWEAYVEAEKASFKEAYAETCLAAAESLTATYTELEYHYTLYSYDRAGNLTHTVPPAGVEKGDPTQHRMRTAYAYTSLNQAFGQETPDGGRTCYWYNDVGQLRFSQNEEQARTDRYAYTRYDGLGRIVEVGEVGLSAFPAPKDNVGRPVCDEDRFTAAQRNDSTWPAWTPQRKFSHVTQTHYDGALTALIDGQPTYTGVLFDGTVRNLRGRVASVTTEVVADDDPATYDSAYHYAYDELGNVTWQVQDVVELAQYDQRFKHTRYTYDRISGNVHAVDYQPDEVDQHHHRFRYDADNRLVTVDTSVDTLIWDRDARYRYYAHGPLARTVLGEYRVQGLDYTYTVQGWIKGVNHQTLDGERDPGRDGLGNGVAPDEFGYVLDYFPGDYEPVGAAAQGYNTALAGDVATDLRPLYNSNIASWVMTTGHFLEQDGEPRRFLFDYDALNRLRGNKLYTGPGVIESNSWASATEKPDDREELSYDPNGNIQTLRRTAKDGVVMDLFDYAYPELSPGQPGLHERQPTNNRLYHVNDGQGDDTLFDEDIDDQGPTCSPLVSTADCNYEYDAVGNMVRDRGEEIAKIERTPSGKVAAIRRMPGSERPELEFGYDPMGHRLFKRVIPAGDEAPTTTRYARDAQGNILAVYEEGVEQVCEEGAYATGSFTVPDVVDLSQGTPVLAVTVGGVDPTAGVPVYWQGSAASTAAAWAAAVNAAVTVPDYAATASGGVVTVVGVEPGVGGGAALAPAAQSTSSAQVPLVQAQSMAHPELACSGLPVVRHSEAWLWGSMRLGARHTGKGSVESDSQAGRRRGTTHYEGPDHLGSVRSTVSDRRRAESPGLVLAAKQADRISATDYYAFGITVPGRSFVSAAEHRFGFNGIERASYSPGVYSADWREYDSRIARWLSPDPEAGTMPWQSPYAAMDNSPNWKSDSGGDVAPIVVWMLKKSGEAAIGVATDIMIQLAAEYYFNDHTSWSDAWDALEINWVQALSSGGEALVKSKNLAALYSTASDVTNYIMSEDDWTWEGAMARGGLAIASAYIGGNVADYAAKYGTKKVSAWLKKEGIDPGTLGLKGKADLPDPYNLDNVVVGRFGFSPRSVGKFKDANFANADKLEGHYRKHVLGLADGTGDTPVFGTIPSALGMGKKQMSKDEYLDLARTVMNMGEYVAKGNRSGYFLEIPGSMWKSRRKPATPMVLWVGVDPSTDVIKTFHVKTGNSIKGIVQ